MKPISKFLACLIVLLALSACTTSAPPTVPNSPSLFASVTAPTSGAVTTEAPTAAPGAPNAAPPTSSNFGVAAIVDTTTQHVTREQAAALITEASGYLDDFAPIPLEMTDFVEDGGGGDAGALAARYINTHAAALPNGLVIFSLAGGEAIKSIGGYGFAIAGPAGFRNAFASPSVGEGLLYVAVVDYNYKYMACGYGGTEQVQGSSSLAGECRGQTGIACVPTNGYSMCSDAVGHLYTTTRTHAAASMIVHGLLHNFGPGGDQDHYSSPECSTRMGYPAGFFDLQQSQYYNELCPFVYETFKNSYKP
jgi:hypothetical protein